LPDIPLSQCRLNELAFLVAGAEFAGDGGFRVYSEQDYERLMVIKQMKPLGFSLEEMAEILQLLTSGEGGQAPGAAKARLAEFLDKQSSNEPKWPATWHRLTNSSRD
jgi:DNA-binding transcriptional MerR regulator